ncbi:MAG: type I-U CRISPR-associated protein Cas5/Cas6 [Acidobacteria bacterium]|nr:type I-U CRISPR-associated protein Cas5/Cas6 [Acidobacteriota bacterium]MYH22860.1 type I-U CRISPR-associated protein Cas5/Cas6 [Acidobacteriota bacterium]MYK80111.1 type I-U CRISPR-associated protein Cas5/Cas6 [Acidobacteriota bacterium]
MFAVSVQFLHGTFRGDPDGTANTGRMTRGEWPPAPARLFAALVAADGTRQESRGTDGKELDWFERLPPPMIHADGDPPDQPLHPRYVVKQSGAPAKSQVHEYVGRTSALVRPGVRVAPRNPCVVYSWEHESPSPSTLTALRYRAARIGYLGASDSPVRVRMLGELSQALLTQAAFRPDPTGDVFVCVQQPGDLRTLHAMYDAWVLGGPSITRAGYPALRHEVPYRSPVAPGPNTTGDFVAWLRLGAGVSGRRVTRLTAAFKDAVLSRYQQLHGEPPAVLHGHGFKVPGYEIARYLALPDAGFAWSRGRIYGLALWTPPGWNLELRRKAGDAARAVTWLYVPELDVAVTPHGGERRPWAANPKRWLRSATRWATAFPAIHERRRPLDLAELSRWCLHAGLPAPIRFRSSRTPLVKGAVDLAPAEVNRPGKPALPYSHVELWFEEPVLGPVVIGSGRQRGLGLCIPVEQEPSGPPSRGDADVSWTNG